MASLCGITEEEAEEEELELYGLNEEEEDSDEERAAVEQAMFMHIHYGTMGKNEEQTEKLALDNTCEASATSKNQESIVDVDNEVDINVNVCRPGINNGSYPDIEKPRAGAHVAQDEGKSALVQEEIEKSDKEAAFNKLDDSVILLGEGSDTNDLEEGEIEKEASKKLNDSVVLDSKYSLTNFASRLRQALTTSRQCVLGKPYGKSSDDTKLVPTITDTSGNVANNLDECYTVATSDSDSDSDVCVLANSPKQEVVENKVSKAHSDATKKASPATKIDRSSFLKLDTSSNTVDGQKVKQRTWKGKNTTAISSTYATDLMSQWEESTMKPEKYRITYSRVQSSAKHGGSGAKHGGSGGKRPVEEVEGENSDDDCMLIESMSEDEDMAFNFVVPLGAGKSKQTGEYTDSQENESSTSTQPGLGSKGPKCLNCNEFGHPARYCPQSKKEVGNNLKTVTGPNRYFHLQSSPKTRGGPKCLNCYEFGHLARNCSEPKRIPTCVLCGEKGHFDRVCPDALCFKCGLPGHRATECESTTPARFAKCWHCGMQGHHTCMCPDKWRQYHLTMKPGKVRAPSQKDRKNWWNAKVYCCNCGKLGHHAYECMEDRMNQHTPVACPFVWRYDYDAIPIEDKHVPKQTAKSKARKKKKAKKLMNMMKKKAMKEMNMKKLAETELAGGRKKVKEIISKLKTETSKIRKKAMKGKKNLKPAPKPVPEENFPRTLKMKKKARKEKKNLKSELKPWPEGNLAAHEPGQRRPQTRSLTRKKRNQLMTQDNDVEILEVSLPNKESKEALKREKKSKGRQNYRRRKGRMKELYTKEERKAHYLEKKRQARKEKKESLQAMEIKVENQPKRTKAERRRAKRQARKANQTGRVVEFVSTQGFQFKFNFAEPY